MNPTRPQASELTVWQSEGRMEGEGSAVGALKEAGRQGSVPSAFICTVRCLYSLQLRELRTPFFRLRMAGSQG